MLSDGSIRHMHAQRTPRKHLSHHYAYLQPHFSSSGVTGIPLGPSNGLKISSKSLIHHGAGWVTGICGKGCCTGTKGLGGVTLTGRIASLNVWFGKGLKTGVCRPHIT